MENELRPNKAELEFLTLAYNRFYDIFEEIMDDSFWEKDSWYRFSKSKEGFAVYSELLNYEPIKWIIEHIKKVRPPLEAEIGSELFKVIRNIINHFPFFNIWDDVWISKSIVNWNKEGQSIDRYDFYSPGLTWRRHGSRQHGKSMGESGHTNRSRATRTH
ncbi:MAG TPA: hypothetical protein VMW72_07495 [Sedimentisphaerales bacterium]|nr:hypothetical protein [Sedimentisphaerales bacterium]